MSTHPEPHTDHGDPHIERARYTKAAKIAEFIEAHFGSSCDPSNEAVRLAAQVLATEGHIADRPQSDRTCEVVRAILKTRDLTFQGAWALAHDRADADAAAADQAAPTTETPDDVRARENAEARSLLENM